MCIVKVSKKKKKEKIEIFHINFENIFSPNIFAARLFDGSNARRTRGVLTCRVHRALVDIATVLLSMADNYASGAENLT